MTLSPLLVPLTFLIVVAVIVQLIARYRLLRRVLDSGLLDERTVQRVLQPTGFSREALKWALLLFFGGLGLVLIAFLPPHRVASSLPYGIEAICLSLGFGLYYRLIRPSDAP
jgi:hypothetical protein